MGDQEIVDLYWKREPDAIEETSRKYGAYCQTIARNILGDARDTEECVNDTWMNAWNAMPKQRPAFLAPFLGKITRNLAFNKYRADHARKRGNGELPLVLDELGECEVAGPSTAQVVETAELERVILDFLHSLPVRECNLFLRRYWFADSISEIAKRYGMNENSVKTNLFRSRKKLKKFLEEEEFL